jgi:hypothetical protein
VVFKILSYWVDRHCGQRVIEIILTQSLVAPRPTDDLIQDPVVLNHTTDNIPTEIHTMTEVKCLKEQVLVKREKGDIASA